MYLSGNLIGNVSIYVSYVAGSFACFFYEDYVIDGSHIFGVLHMMAQSYCLRASHCVRVTQAPRKRFEDMNFSHSPSRCHRPASHLAYDHMIITRWLVVKSLQTVATVGSVRFEGKPDE